MRIYFLVPLAAVLALPTLALAAQSDDPNSKACAEKSGAESIAGCTAAIQAGNMTSAGLAIMFYDRGNAYFNQNDYARAIADYNEAIRVNPRYAEPFNNRANIYRKQKDYARALADYDRAIGLNPKFAYALYGRGLVKAELGNSRGSKADIARALAVNPGIAAQF